jgi:hypothetical protein
MILTSFIMHVHLWYYVNSQKWKIPMLHVVSPTFYQGWSVMCNDPPLDYEMWLLNTDTVHAAPDFDS